MNNFIAQNCPDLSTKVTDAEGRTVVAETKQDFLTGVSTAFDDGVTQVGVGTDYNCVRDQGYVTDSTVASVQCTKQGDSYVWSPWQCKSRYILI